MRFVIITGMSGAGKSTVLHVLEDAGYYCADNLPVSLIPNFVEIMQKEESGFDKFALGVDARTGNELEGLDEVLLKLRNGGIEYEILFLESDKSVLIKRYKETRRVHPLASNGRIEDGIDKERELLAGIKKQASCVINTSGMLVRELKAEIDKVFVRNQNYKNLYITILSFGFKYGIPADADLVFDVRFLPNPYYIDELKPLTGNDKPIQEYVMQHKDATLFLDKLEDMLAFLMPRYITEGKNQLVVAIGCTGGRHRSVTLSNELFDRMNKYSEYGFKLVHRDINH